MRVLRKANIYKCVSITVILAFSLTNLTIAHPQLSQYPASEKLSVELVFQQEMMMDGPRRRAIHAMVEVYNALHGYKFVREHPGALEHIARVLHAELPQRSSDMRFEKISMDGGIINIPIGEEGEETQQIIQVTSDPAFFDDHPHQVGSWRFGGYAMRLLLRRRSEHETRLSPREEPIGDRIEEEERVDRDDDAHPFRPVSAVQWGAVTAALAYVFLATSVSSGLIGGDITGAGLALAVMGLYLGAASAKFLLLAVDSWKALINEGVPRGRALFTAIANSSGYFHEVRGMLGIFPMVAAFEGVIGQMRDGRRSQWRLGALSAIIALGFSPVVVDSATHHPPAGVTMVHDARVVVPTELAQLLEEAEVPVREFEMQFEEDRHPVGIILENSKDWNIKDRVFMRELGQVLVRWAGKENRHLFFKNFLDDRHDILAQEAMIILLGEDPDTVLTVLREAPSGSQLFLLERYDQEKNYRTIAVLNHQEIKGYVDMQLSILRALEELGYEALVHERQAWEILSSAISRSRSDDSYTSRDANRLLGELANIGLFRDLALGVLVDNIMEARFWQAPGDAVVAWAVAMYRTGDSREALDFLSGDLPGESIPHEHNISRDEGIAEALGIIGRDEAVYDDAVKRLGEMLGDYRYDPGVRVAAARALGDLGGEKAEAVLRGALGAEEDVLRPSPEVRDAIGHALESIEMGISVTRVFPPLFTEKIRPTEPYPLERYLDNWVGVARYMNDETYGRDIGTDRGFGSEDRREELTERFAEWQEQGVKVARIFTFASMAEGGMVFDDAGMPTGLADNAIEDLETLLDTAEEYEIKLIPVLFDFYLARDHPELIRDPEKRSALIQVLQRDIPSDLWRHPSVMMWESMNEPEGGPGVSDDVITGSDMQDFVEEVTLAVVDMAPGVPVTVGVLNADGLNRYYTLADEVERHGGEYTHQFHYYPENGHFIYPRGMLPDGRFIIGEVGTREQYVPILMGALKGGYPGGFFWQDGEEYAPQIKEITYDLIRELRERDGATHPFRPLDGLMASLLAGITALVATGVAAYLSAFTQMGMPILSLGVLTAAVYFGCAAARYLRLFMESYSTLRDRGISPRGAFFTEIANSLGMRHSVFEELSPQVQRYIDIHEGLSHFAGMFVLLPGLDVFSKGAYARSRKVAELYKKAGSDDLAEVFEVIRSDMAELREMASGRVIEIEISDPGDEDRLISYLGDDQENVREIAARKLKGLLSYRARLYAELYMTAEHESIALDRDMEELPGLLTKALEHENRKVSDRAARLLAMVGDEGCYERLEEYHGKRLDEVEGEITKIRRDRNLRKIELSLTPEHDDRSDVLGWLDRIAGDDPTPEYSRAEQALREAEERLKALEVLRDEFEVELLRYRDLLSRAAKREEPALEDGDEEVLAIFREADVLINNRVDRSVLAGNKIIDHLNEQFRTLETDRVDLERMDRESPAALIRARLIECIDHLEIFWGQRPYMDQPEDIVEAKETVLRYMDHIEVDIFISSLIVQARRARRDRQKLIIGLETAWIPGYEAGDVLKHNTLNPLVSQIMRLASTMSNLGLDNIEVVHAAGSELADNLKRAAERSDTDHSHIIALASKDTIDSYFGDIRSAPGKRGAFLAAVDPTNLEDFYREDRENAADPLLLEMLTILLELATGKGLEGIPYEHHYDAMSRIITFIPEAHVIEYDRLQEKHRAQRWLLESA